MERDTLWLAIDLRRGLCVQLIDEIATMGFSRRDVQGAITDISRSGQSVDLNVILDRLMNGPRV